MQIPNVIPIENQIAQSPPQSFCLHDSQGNPLPNWAQFYFQLGFTIAYSQTSSRRIGVAMVIPTRSYASVFVGMGSLMGYYWRPEQRPADAVKAFTDNLKDAAIGSPAHFLKNGIRTTGIFQGIEERNGERWLKIFLPKHRLTQYIQSTKAHTVEIAKGAAQACQHEKRPEHLPSIVIDTIHKEALVPFSLQETTVCNLIGPQSMLRNEIVHTEIGLSKSGGEPQFGRPQDILRVRQLTTKGASHTDLFATMSELPHQLQTTSVTILEGSRANRLAHKAISHSSIVQIVSRRDPAFSNVISDLNQQLSTRKREKCDLFDSLDPPAGVELAYYWSTK